MARKKSAGRVVRKTLADGTEKVYRYAPFKARRAKDGDTLNAMIRAYRRSPDFRALRPSSSYAYNLYLRPLEEIGRGPAAGVSKKHLNAMRDKIAAERGNGAASLFVSVASKLFSWAVESDWLKVNPAFRLKPPSLGEITTWSQDQADQAEATLPEHLRRIIVLARYTAQRRGDLCGMTWAAYDGSTIRLTQQKTGVALVVPCHPRLKAELDAWRRSATTVTILTNGRGQPASAKRIGDELVYQLTKAGMPRGLTLHGLRKLAATELAEAGCSTHEIASITGHKTLAMIQHYTKAASQRTLATAAIIRLSESTTATTGRKTKSKT